MGMFVHDDDNYDYDNKEEENSFMNKKMVLMMVD